MFRESDFALRGSTIFLLQLLEKALSGYDAQKEAKDAKAAKEPSKVSKTRKSRLAPDPHPPTEVCRLRGDVPPPPTPLRGEEVGRNVRLHIG